MTKHPSSLHPAWARKKGLLTKPAGGAGPKVAYFAGCTASYLFPQVAIAAVSFLERCGIKVWLPPQQCCGMPAYLEGDRKLALAFARRNVAVLGAAVEDGFDIVCSCPTCGFLLRNLLKSGACYAT